MRVWPVLCSLSLLFGNRGALAQSDLVEGEEGDWAHDARIVSQTARVTISAGHAEWITRIEAAYDGVGRASAEIWFEAEGAVGTGLSLLEPDGRRIDGRLLSASRAARTFARLAGPGYATRDPGWMRQVSPGALAISVLPVLSGQSRTFEYRVALPTRYEDGRHRLPLPGFEGEVTVESGEQAAQLFLDGASLPRGSVVSVADSPELALELSASPSISAELAVVPLAGRHFVRVEARLAAELQPVPRDAAVVIAIDGSRSMGRRGALAAQVAARAYLDHFASGRVRVLRFARHARWEQPSFVSPSAASRALDQPMLLENGSDVTEALRTAASALRDVDGEKRILLLTDARRGRELTPAALDEAMRASGALVHTVVVEPSLELSVPRVDGHAWAPATHATGGVLWKLLLPEASLARATLRPLVEEWAHPVELEHVAWSSDGLVLRTPPRRVPRGAGLLHEGFSFAAPSEVKLTGMLWSKRVELRVERDAAASRRWSRLLLGSALATELSPAEDARLAEQTRSVSTTRSLLAVEPGATPVGGAPLSDLIDISRGVAGEPYAPTELLFTDEPPSRDCAACWQRPVTEAVAGGLEVSLPEERQARDDQARALSRDLAARLRDLAARCGVNAGHAEVETTLDEIVSVKLDVTPASSRACLESAAWSLTLDSSFMAAAYQSYRIDVTQR